eukprot:4233694-Prymnesium_polylepis.1
MQNAVDLAKTFSVVFIAEWGDRTQLVMIGLHASRPVVPIVVGAAASPHPTGWSGARACACTPPPP